MTEKKAIALKYPEGVDAPIVLAKGSGSLAQKIIDEAKKKEVLIKEDTLLVEMLGLSNVGEVVPESTWEILAQIFAFIMERK
ncbi:MAG: EscU/YscU/HrcU family type III secretion system export apparatus switch protein [Treponema sp.]|nr:EscU/YscU/HrcU family type III secretion system export apparatus switch protein [Treponema sp.]MCI5519414.1 EscU/YscU/HrcU family type III secretion system export apparatus switch protein [Treponema sp.]MCI7566780.1 EscU/YscU/HrcU family type III secretion system export apparatus switch protein [Treponema sp.]